MVTKYYRVNTFIHNSGSGHPLGNPMGWIYCSPPLPFVPLETPHGPAQPCPWSLSHLGKMGGASAAVNPVCLALLHTPTSVASAGSHALARGHHSPLAVWSIMASLEPCREHEDRARNGWAGQHRHTHVGKGSLGSRDVTGEEQGSISVPAGKNP